MSNGDENRLRNRRKTFLLKSYALPRSRDLLLVVMLSSIATWGVTRFAESNLPKAPLAAPKIWLQIFVGGSIGMLSYINGWEDHKDLINKKEEKQ